MFCRMIENTGFAFIDQDKTRVAGRSRVEIRRVRALLGKRFCHSKSYRKMSRPDLTPNYVIPLSLRNSWMINDNISFGIYDWQC